MLWFWRACASCAPWESLSASLLAATLHGEVRTLALDLSASEPALICDLSLLGLRFPTRGPLGSGDRLAPKLGEQRGLWVEEAPR